MQLSYNKIHNAYHLPREPILKSNNEDWMCMRRTSVDVEGCMRREQRRNMMDMIEYNVNMIWATWQHTILWSIYILLIPLCQKARHQRDSCRRHYQSQKQRQMPYPLQAMILYCQCQCNLHLLFHKERVFHQKPWLKMDTSSYVGVRKKFDVEVVQIEAANTRNTNK